MIRCRPGMNERHQVWFYGLGDEDDPVERELARQIYWLSQSHPEWLAAEWRDAASTFERLLDLRGQYRAALEATMPSRPERTMADLARWGDAIKVVQPMAEHLTTLVRRARKEGDRTKGVWLDSEVDCPLRYPGFPEPLRSEIRSQILFFERMLGDRAQRSAPLADHASDGGGLATHPIEPVPDSRIEKEAAWRFAEFRAAFEKEHGRPPIGRDLEILRAASRDLAERDMRASHEVGSLNVWKPTAGKGDARAPSPRPAAAGSRSRAKPKPPALVEVIIRRGKIDALDERILEAVKRSPGIGIAGIMREARTKHGPTKAALARLEAKRLLFEGERRGEGFWPA
jgi:hypothetical protein